MLTRFDCMGCTMSLQLDDDHDRAGVARDLLERLDRRLSRFDPASELCALNRDPRPTVPASAVLRSAIRAACRAAERSGGLVDPTLLDDLERHGYRASLSGVRPPTLRGALAVAPPRRPARPSGRARWRQIVIDDEHATITRPPGLRLDTGGSTKGLAADAVAHLLDARRAYVIDCGGDLRISAPRPIEVRVEDPLTGADAHTLAVASGAVATSGLGRRLWRDEAGGYAHHLLDPSTGAPAWTGLLSATALAPTALEAETLAKTALLSGPRAARRILLARGGVLIHDDGTVEPVGRGARPPLRVAVQRVAA
jgi:thiamine biosynthesis lipoprotein